MPVLLKYTSQCRVNLTPSCASLLGSGAGHEVRRPSHALKLCQEAGGKLNVNDAALVAMDLNVANNERLIRVAFAAAHVALQIHS